MSTVCVSRESEGAQVTPRQGRRQVGWEGRGQWSLVTAAEWYCSDTTDLSLYPPGKSEEAAGGGGMQLPL